MNTVLKSIEPAPVQLTRNQADALRRIRDQGPDAWAISAMSDKGAALAKMFDRMADRGLCTRFPYRIMPAGREALDRFDARGKEAT
jgi:hypothetical protein